MTGKFCSNIMLQETMNGALIVAQISGAGLSEYGVHAWRTN